MNSPTLLNLHAAHPEKEPDKEFIVRAAEALRAGKLVAFPTETVYGLGGDATNEQAVAAIFAAKGRPSFNPLIVHMADFSQLSAYVEITPLAENLAAHFMPGALTLVLPRKKDSALSWLVSAGMDSLAVRIPSHAVARALLREVNRPIAAPSANRSGSVSATSPLHVLESLGNKVDLILGAGRSPIGLESTILDVTGDVPIILRQGGITQAEIEVVIGKVKVFTGHSETPTAPGQLQSHYAPNARVRLNATHADADEALLAFGPEMGIKSGKMKLNLSERGDLHEAAANLFAMLRELDKPEITTIAVMQIPETGLGLAMNDRLRRAAAPRDDA
ncbi:MAG: L-threonylcarbamoyladenylate synthase [Alphaproteobacteria bacterium]|nr:L-threonylcarbamoyladenylate synthase [Alphaproteobacteria bacterium]